MNTQLEEVYYDRNLAVLAMAKMALALGYEVGLTAESEGEYEWPVICIELPTGQVTYHIPYYLVEEFDHETNEMFFYTRTWDGHDTIEKRKRVLNYIRDL